MRLFRPRTLVYFGAWAGIGLAMLFALGNRTRIDVSVLQTRNPQWVRLSDGSIRNGYTVKVRNMEERPRTVEISIDGLAGATLWTEASGRSGASTHLKLDVAPDQVAQTQLFVGAPGSGPERDDMVFTVRALDAEGGVAHDTTYFERPEHEE